MAVNVEIRKAEGAEWPELTAIAFAAKRHWGYPEKWIDLWVDELTIDSQYIERNRVFVANAEARTLGWCAVLAEERQCWLDYCWVLLEARVAIRS